MEPKASKRAISLNNDWCRTSLLATQPFLWKPQGVRDSVVHLFLIVWPLYPMLASFAQGNALSTLCSLILLQLLSSFSTAITSALTVECVNERKKIWVFAALIMWVYIIKLYTFLQQHYSIRNTPKLQWFLLKNILLFLQLGRNKSTNNSKQF